MDDAKIRNMEEFSAVSGISRPTVSKYFNDPASVRNSTRLRIEDALRRYDFRPNLFAMNQNRKSTRTVCILVPHVSDPFYAEIVRLLELHCLEAGYWSVVLSAHGEAEGEAHALDMLQSLKPAGVIMAPLGRGSQDERLAQLTRDLPTVLFDSRLEIEGAFVGTDNFQSIGLMVDYLCRSGSAPHFLEMPAVNHNAHERRAAYLRAMERQNLDARVIEVGAGDWQFEALGYNEGMRLLGGQGMQGATLLCANDRMAIGLLSAAWEQGLRVGRGPATALRIAGHDDHPLSRFTCPPLTTVAQDYPAIASSCAAKLFAMIEAGSPTAAAGDLHLEAKLILRASA